jgi:putative ABC transport system permease protein
VSLWRQFRYGWRSLTNRKARDREVAEELAQYFAEAEAEWQTTGLAPDEAKKAVRHEQGTIARAREQASEYGWENTVRNLRDDLRFARRQLGKHPAFTLTAVFTLALGIGANTAIFTVVENVLLAPLPYNNADRLAVLETYRSELGRAIPRVTGPDATDVQSQARSLEALSLYWGGSLGVQLENHAAYATVTVADENFARVFRLVPVAGRWYTEAEAKRAAVVSERFARENFGNAQNAIGKSIQVENQPLVITGVVGNGFAFPEGSQVWMAASKVPESQSRTSFNYKAVALLREANFRSAQTEMSTLSARLRAAYPKEDHGKDMVLKPLRTALTGDAKPTLVFVWSSAGLILLIACVIVMHLELVRSIERQRELAIRRALGSSRWRVMQPVFLESLLLGLLGGGCGILLAYPTVRLLVVMAPKELPRTSEIHLNLWVLGFAIALALTAAVLSAILPALRAAQADPAEALKSDSSRGMTRRSASVFRNGMVVAEVAITFVLAAGAALLVRTLLALQERDMGYASRQLLVVDADAPAQKESDGLKAAQQFSDLFTRLGHLPGVTRVAGVMGLPTGDYGSNGYYQIEGGPPADGEHATWSNFSVASPGYFGTMGIPLKRGRDFGSGDTYESQMVAVISESLARQSFGKADPVGKQIKCGLDSDKWMLIVGEVGDVRQSSPAEQPGPTLYMPMTQHPYFANQIHIVLRTAVAPLSVMSAADRTIARVNPLIARRYTTMDAMLVTSTATERFRAALISCFAGMGILLAMLGVYGTVAYAVAQRRVEFGIRMAFGAERSAILRSVLEHAVSMAGLGTLIGIALSIPLARLIESMLAGVRPMDPLSLGLVSFLLILTALAAALGPGWTATRISPMSALRVE